MYRLPVKALVELAPRDCNSSGSHIPLGYIGATEEVAEAVALLVSDRGKFIVGVIYRVDGGMTGA
jgi:NAD(P)-dependent dehydrogenase (short-subunit alcohol dehydrogenase family)